MKEIRDRIVGEQMLDGIFLSPYIINKYMNDQADLLYYRKDSTLRVVYTDKLRLDDCKSFDLWKESISQVLENVSFSAYILELSDSSQGKGISNSFVDDLYSFMRSKSYRCGLFRNKSIKIEDEEIVLNLYAFSAKKEEDWTMDRKVYEMTKVYKDIYCYSGMGWAESLHLDADSRLGAYTKLISFLSVDSHSAEYIKELIEDVLQLVEDDLKKGHKIEISTFQGFASLAGNLWMQLAPYFIGHEFEKTPHNWERILRKMRGGCATLE